MTHVQYCSSKYITLASDTIVHNFLSQSLNKTMSLPAGFEVSHFVLSQNIILLISFNDKILSS